MLKIDGYILPRDFINRHGNPRRIPSLDLGSDLGYSKCRCGHPFYATGHTAEHVKSVPFKEHLVEAFRAYKSKQLKLIGGNANG